MAILCNVVPAKLNVKWFFCFLYHSFTFLCKFENLIRKYIFHISNFFCCPQMELSLVLIDANMVYWQSITELKGMFFELNTIYRIGILISTLKFSVNLFLLYRKDTEQLYHFLCTHLYYTSSRYLSITCIIAICYMYFDLFALQNDTA